MNIVTSLVSKISICKNNIHFNGKAKIRASRQNILFKKKMSLYEAACTLAAPPDDAFRYTQQSNQHPCKIKTFPIIWNISHKSKSNTIHQMW